MNISNMHNAVKIELDKTSSLELPAFEPEEIDYWLNQGIETFVNQRYQGLNRAGTSFEETEKRIADLRTIVTDPVTLLPSISSVHTNGYEFDIPTNYLYTFLCEARINFVDSNGVVTNDVVACRDTKSDLYSIKRSRDPFSEHILYMDWARPIKFVRDNDIIVVTDGNYSVTSLYLSYIKRPVTVSYTSSISCDLPDHTHSEIVKITVSKMLENIESQRYIPYNTEVLKME